MFPSPETAPKPRPRPSRAFTLMELLTALGVAVLLCALLFPAYRAAVNQSRAAACISNLGEIVKALMLYRADHNGELIPDQRSGSNSSHWTGAVDAYLGVPNPGVASAYSKVWSCPANPALPGNPKLPVPYDGSAVSYARNRNLIKGNFTGGYNASRVGNAGTLILAIERRVGHTVGTALNISSMTELKPGEEEPNAGFFDHPGGTSVAFVDGHIEPWPRTHPGLGGGKAYPASVKGPEISRYWFILP